MDENTVHLRVKGDCPRAANDAPASVAIQQIESYPSLDAPAASLKISIPGPKEVGVPAAVLVVLPDGRKYALEARIPSKGFEGMDTSLSGALNHGLPLDDFLLFKRRLRVFGITEEACFNGFYSDTVEFLRRIAGKCERVLADHSEKSPATVAACSELRGALRFTLRGLRKAGFLPESDAAELSARMKGILERYEGVLGRRAVHHRSPPPRKKRDWEF